MAISVYTKVMKGLNILAALTVVALSAAAFASLCRPINHVPSIIKNWEQQNIYDITTVDANQTCPFGYEQINTFKWPGSSEGCYCRGTNKVEPQTCDKSPDCYSIPATSEFEISSWRHRTICVWRGGTSVFWAPMPEDEECSDKKDVNGEEGKFIKCGVGDEAVCTEAVLGCPISKIAVVPAAEERPVGYSHSAYFSEDLGLYFDKSGETSMPVVDFEVFEDNPCFEPVENTGHSEKAYADLMEEVVKACEIYDSRYVVVDSLGEQEFLAGQKEDLSPLYTLDPDDEYSYHLAYRTSILWKSVCRNEYYSREKLDKNKEPLDLVETIQILLLVVDVTFAVYLIIVDPLVFYCYYSKAEEDICEFDKPLLTMLIAEMIIKFIMIPVIFVCCFIISYYRNWYDNLEHRFCTDPLTNAGFQYVEYVLYDVYVYNWINFGICMGLIFADIFLLFRLFFYKTIPYNAVFN